MASRHHGVQREPRLGEADPAGPGGGHQARTHPRSGKTLILNVCEKVVWCSCECLYKCLVTANLNLTRRENRIMEVKVLLFFKSPYAQSQKFIVTKLMATLSTAKFSAPKHLFPHQRTSFCPITQYLATETRHVFTLMLVLVFILMCVFAFENVRVIFTSKIVPQTPSHKNSRVLAGFVRQTQLTACASLLTA